jgi:hypothetical protein
MVSGPCYLLLVSIYFCPFWPGVLRGVYLYRCMVSVCCMLQFVARALLTLLHGADLLHGVYLLHAVRR